MGHNSHAVRARTKYDVNRKQLAYLREVIYDIKLNVEMRVRGHLHGLGARKHDLVSAALSRNIFQSVLLRDETSVQSNDG